MAFNYRTTIEQLNNEISALETRISAIKKQVDLPTTENDIKLQMETFIKV
jgi:regulator of replication initiation timing